MTTVNCGLECNVYHEDPHAQLVKSDTIIYKVSIYINFIHACTFLALQNATSDYETQFNYRDTNKVSPYSIPQDLICKSHSKFASKDYESIMGQFENDCIIQLHGVVIDAHIPILESRVYA